MKSLKYISLLAVGGLIYILCNHLTAANGVTQSRQVQNTPSATLNSIAAESYPLIYDVITTLIPAIKY